MSEYLIRPGLTLSWGAVPPLSTTPAAPPDSSAVLTFVLVGETAHRDDCMVLSPAHAHGSLSFFAPAGAFHVSLRLSEVALQELLHDDKTPGAAQVRAFAAESLDPVATALAIPLTPGARLAVESIRRCPFVGACRGMALTARCHDLLLEFLTALSNQATAPSRAPLLTRTVDEQIRAAADYLAQHLEEPPTLARLARHVGLSETSLKRGFQQVFASTVFGYLRTRRMERAHALLQAGEATVLEAAALVGYSNPSNFAAAFRRQFGLNPKAFQLTARR